MSNGDLPLLKTIKLVGGEQYGLKPTTTLKTVKLNLFNSTKSQLRVVVTNICADITDVTKDFDWDNANFKQLKLIGTTLMKLSGKLSILKNDCQEDEIAVGIIEKTISILCVDLQTAYDEMRIYLKDNPMDADNYDRVNYLNFLNDLLGTLSTLIPQTSDYIDKGDDLLLDSEELRWFD